MAEIAPWKQGRCASITQRCQRCKRKFHPHYTNKDAKFCSHRCSGKQKAPDARRMSTAEAAWLAGLFDGEGSIIWPKGEASRSVRLNIANTNVELLEAVRRRTGTGRVVLCLHEKSKGWKPHYKRGFAWQCYSDNARKILRQMLPWLIEKNVPRRSSP